MTILSAKSDTARAHVELLILEATAMKVLGADVLDATDIAADAIDYALRGVAVFPLNGKVPAIPSAHPPGDPLRNKCKGECGRLGHGVYDATTDLAKIISWWTGRYRGCNIGGRVPDNVLVLDVDPRHGGDRTLAELVRRHCQLPATMMTISGRGDGGCHYWFRRPPGKLSSKYLGPGLDIKTSTGYVVLPPSIHPVSLQPYRRVDGPIANPPAWLARLMMTTTTPGTKRSTSQPRFTGRSIIEEYNAGTEWADVLTPHGWRVVAGDGDSDGSRWLHPTATSSTSASISGGRLYVFSTNTPFDVTEASDPHGYSRFHAYAVLNHGGDMTAAARHLKGIATA